jgi:hypothetical protein
MKTFVLGRDRKERADSGIVENALCLRGDHAAKLLGQPDLVAHRPEPVRR